MNLNRSQKNKLIVFDIDDTLTKSESQHQLSYVNTMKEMGISKIDQNWKGYTHHTDSFILKENYENNFTANFNWSFIPDFEMRMTQILKTLKPVTPVRGAVQMIEDLKSRPAYKFIFATGSLLQPAYLKLEQAGIHVAPELVIGSNNIYEREGIVSEAINAAKSYYQIDEFEEIISVGDGPWDHKTAQNLNIHFIGIGLKNQNYFDKENIKMHLKDWANFKLDAMEAKLNLAKTSAT